MSWGAISLLSCGFGANLQVIGLGVIFCLHIPSSECKSTQRPLPESLGSTSGREHVKTSTQHFLLLGRGRGQSPLTLPSATQLTLLCHAGCSTLAVDDASCSLAASDRVVTVCRPASIPLWGKTQERELMYP